jgi:NAD(P)-dependent dehydrogenase (short-subunit alcohol dehydrogenase family)
MASSEAGIMGVVQDKVALVTGGTSGIGLAAASRLAQEGAHVFITGRSRQRLDEAVAQIGHCATGVVSDVSNFEDISAVVDAIHAHGHGLDVVFTNAGGGEFGTIADVTVENYLDTFNRNVGGTLFTVQKVLPLLNRGASVILAGSTAASKGTPRSVFTLHRRRLCDRWVAPWPSSWPIAASGSTPWSPVPSRLPGWSGWHPQAANPRCWRRWPTVSS